MRKALVALRREAGLTQQDVADFMGCTQQAVQKLERYDADPQLSTLRRYANAVGAVVSHQVRRDDSVYAPRAYAERPASTVTTTSASMQVRTSVADSIPVSLWEAAESKRTDFALSA